MATSTGLKITFKAAAVESAGDEPAAKKPRPSAGGGAPWHTPRLGPISSKRSPPPPPRPERSALGSCARGARRRPRPFAMRPRPTGAKRSGVVARLDARHHQSKRPAGGQTSRGRRRAQHLGTTTSRTFSSFGRGTTWGRPSSSRAPPVPQGVQESSRAGRVRQGVRAEAVDARGRRRGQRRRGQTASAHRRGQKRRKDGHDGVGRHLDGTSLPARPTTPARRFEPVPPRRLTSGKRVRVLWMEPNGESAWHGANVQVARFGNQKHHIAYDDGTGGGRASTLGEEKVEAVVDGD